MYIHKISLRNVRGFETLDFDLDRGDGTYAGWTVFLGNNGSGKTTLLRSVAMCLAGPDAAKALLPSFRGWIRQGVIESESEIEVDVVPKKNDDYCMYFDKYGFENNIKALMKFKDEKGDTFILNDDKAVSDMAVKTVWSYDSSTSGWFSCAYGPFRRIFGASPGVTRQMIASPTARFVTMFQESASLAEADKWLRDLNYKKLENKLEEKLQLEMIMALLDDGLLPSSLSIDRVDSDGLWLKDKNNVTLSWQEMSDGYRSVIALITDIVRHLMVAYGSEGLIKSDESGHRFIDRSGVVFIDEVDAHLHPEWQQRIGFWLKQRFPKIQFLVTTHSPIICQAADPKGLFVLPEPGSGDAPRQLDDEDYQKVVSSRPDTILLTPAFGLESTYSPKAVESRSKLAALNSKQRAGATLTVQEKAEVKQLQFFVNPDEEP